MRVVAGVMPAYNHVRYACLLGLRSDSQHSLGLAGHARNGYHLGLKTRQRRGQRVRFDLQVEQFGVMALATGGQRFKRQRFATENAFDRIDAEFFLGNTAPAVRWVDE